MNLLYYREVTTVSLGFFSVSFDSQSEVNNVGLKTADSLPLRKLNELYHLFNVSLKILYELTKPSKLLFLTYCLRTFTRSVTMSSKC